MRPRLAILFFLCLAVLPAWPAPAAGAPAVAVTIRATHPHDPTLFTQGFFIYRGVLYESGGGYGRSRLQAVRLTDGRRLSQRALAPELFGEGACRYGDHLVQLTWQSGRGFVYRLEGLAFVSDFRYHHQGWGITSANGRLFVSDGTDRILFWQGLPPRPVGGIRVHDQGRPVTRLNELEYVAGAILANIWQTARIARIHPASGRVLAFLDCAAAVARARAAGATGVLNGIAWDGENEKLYITGKDWPVFFEIALPPGWERPPGDQGPETAAEDMGRNR